MPSPFPGMDPYLEDPGVFPDLHNSIAGNIRDELNARLPRPYYARLESRAEIGVGDEAGRRVVPDVTISRRRSDSVPVRPVHNDSGGVAVAAPPAVVRQTEPVRIGFAGEPYNHLMVEIRDPRNGHALVTLFEIVSPSNKKSGPDRDAYLDKQRRVLESDANLIEIDLLSAGRPVVATPAVRAALDADPAAAGRRYLVTVNRAWRRGPTGEYEAYPCGLRDPLPCIAVPLREADDEILLDLQGVFDSVYDRGPYARGLVDYAAPPAVPLTPDEAEWTRGRVAAVFGPAVVPEPGPSDSEAGRLRPA